MAEFQELIKNFDRIRDYMRQFYIYGFKVRNDFQDKSPRTYDNERRRIESWLEDYTQSDYTPKGKHVYINVDSKTISQNPLYAAWKSKSFTDNDLMLHFFILADILTAVREQRLIRFENKSSRSGQISTLSGVPLKIFVSTQTGRRYLCLYLPERRRFSNSRLDSITRVTLLEPCTFYEEVLRDLEKNKEKCWGVSFGGGASRMEEVCIKLYIDEEKEPYILNRLYREGRGGEVLKIRENQFLYTGTFFDTNEMLSWVKTFTGRIMDIQGTNLFSIAKITRDWEKMYEMYCGNEE